MCFSHFVSYKVYLFAIMVIVYCIIINACISKASNKNLFHTIFYI